MLTHTLSTTIRSTALRAVHALPSASAITDVATYAAIAGAALWGWLALAAALS